MTIVAESLKSLEAQMRTAERDIAVVAESVDTSRKKQAELLSRRRDLVILARSKRDKDAQAALDIIDADLAKLEKDIVDDESALASLKDSRVDLQAKRDRATWHRDKEQLLQHLQRRLDDGLPAKMQAAVIALKECAAELSERDAETARALLNFDSFLRVDSSRIKGMSQARGSVIGATLSDLVPSALNAVFIRMNRGADLEAQFARSIRQAIDSVESIEIAV